MIERAFVRPAALIKNKKEACNSVERKCASLTSGCCLGGLGLSCGWFGGGQWL